MSGTGTGTITPAETTRRRRQVVVAAALVLANLALLLVLIGRLPWRLDLTTDQRYSLSDTSRELAASLPEPVLIRAFVPRDLVFPYHDHHRQIANRLREYADASRGRIRVELVDPGESAALREEAELLGLRTMEYRATTERGDERRTVVLGAALFSGDRRAVVPSLQRLDDLEFEITRRLRDLATGRELPRVGLLTGHGEIDLLDLPDDHPVRPLLTVLQESYTLVAVAAGRDRLDDLDALLVLGPRQTVRRRHLYELDQFVMSGRPLALFLPSVAPDLSTVEVEPAEHGLDRLLTPWGLQLGSGVVLDRSRYGQLRLPVRTPSGVDYQPFDSPLVPVVANIATDNPALRHLESLVMPLAAPLAPTEDAPPEVSFEELAWTSAEAS